MKKIESALRSKNINKLLLQYFLLSAILHGASVLVLQKISPYGYVYLIIIFSIEQLSGFQKIRIASIKTAVC